MSNQTQLRDILDRAADLPSERRQSYLDSACGSDRSLRAEVESLLDQLETAADFTVTSKQPGIGPAALTPSSTGSPETIGPYTLLDQIGEGGMGTVYRARQEHPIRRTVALKLIRGEFGSAQVIARFEAERQALARMDHPNIAKILDAGTHAGMPYFVMELVAGSPITRFCDQHRLSISDRLELFAQVCDGIAHAHTKAILHRDIKAGNVLAYLVDDKSRVKVIDFGIAKALSDDVLSDHLARTQEGRPIGTYESMSPEQAAGSPDVDTRTDVYALGMMLYELLCGFKPFAGKMVPGIDVLEIQWLIRDVNPPRPSARVSPSSDDSQTPAIAVVRRTNPGDLSKKLRSELEWIPMKAVRKERDRRYDSAAQLAEDVRNYLAGRPLIAGPDTRRYRVGKIVRRNKGVIGTLTSVFVVLLLGVAGTGIGLVREAKARRIAENQTREADRQRTEAESQRDNAAAVVSFLTDDVLAQAAPEHTFDKSARDVLVKTLLMPAGENVQKRFAGKPLVEASVRDMLALTLNDLGRSDLALPHARAAFELRRSVLGLGHADTIGSESDYALVLQSAGRAAEAEPFYKEALASSRAKLRAEDPITIRLLNDYGTDLDALNRSSEAEPMFVAALASSRRAWGEESPLTLTSLNNYAGALFRRGEPAKAEPLYKLGWETRHRTLGDDYVETINELDCYAVTLCALDRVEEAEPLEREALERRRRVLGDEHPDTVQSMNNYADILNRLKRWKEAAPLARDAWRRRGILFGPDSTDAAVSAAIYGDALEKLGNFDEASKVFRQLLDRDERILPPGDPATTDAMRQYAGSLYALQEWEQVKAVYKKLWDRNRTYLGDQNSLTLIACDRYASTLFNLKRFADAEPLFGQCAETALNSAALGPDSRTTKIFATSHAETLDRLGRHEDARMVRRRFGLATAVVERPG